MPPRADALGAGVMSPALTFELECPRCSGSKFHVLTHASTGASLNGVVECECGKQLQVVVQLRPVAVPVAEQKARSRRRVALRSPGTPCHSLSGSNGRSADLKLERPATGATVAGQVPPLSGGADMAETTDGAQEALIRLSAIAENARYALGGSLDPEQALANIEELAGYARRVLREAH